MSILISIQHPAHVHFFKNAIWELERFGTDVRVVAREKDIALDLLDLYDIQHTILAGDYDQFYQLPLVQAQYELEIMRLARKINPDVLMAIGEPSIAHAAKLTPGKSFIFTDTEHANITNAITFPFADYVFTPECYNGTIGSQQVRYPGYHELAYLHPDRFDPDPNILDELKVDPSDKIVIMRLVSWDAAHDIGDSGFNDITDVVAKLEEAGARVIISSEAELPDEVEYCRSDVPVHKMHDLMYYADLFMGESATMATESAVLGTPAIFVSSSRRGYTDELEDEYGIVFNFSGEGRQQEALMKTVDILEQYEAERWERTRERILEEKIDTTKFILDQVRKASR